jgi:hypothetical protein
VHHLEEEEEAALFSSETAVSSMFPFAESARAHVSFAGAHHNGYTLHTALFSHEKFPPPESLLFLFLKKKNTVHTWEPNTHTNPG